MNRVALSPHAGAHVRQTLNRSIGPASLRSDFRQELRQRLLADAERLAGRRNAWQFRCFGKTLRFTRGQQASAGLLLSLAIALLGAVLYYRFCHYEE
jgi:hypothetical protein